VSHAGLVGKISGSGKKPRVSGTLEGHDEIAGDKSFGFNASLHLTSVTCPAISGNIVPMIREIAGPKVLRVLIIDGKGDWTAKRTD
jgi:hypothetical protein